MKLKFVTQDVNPATTTAVHINRQTLNDDGTAIGQPAFVQEVYDNPDSTDKAVHSANLAANRALAAAICDRRNATQE